MHSSTCNLISDYFRYVKGAGSGRFNADFASTQKLWNGLCPMNAELDHDKGPRCQFPASADQAVVVFVMVTGLCNRKLSASIIGFSKISESACKS